jgi:DNA-binding MurR/RpiR family transcriptional regulator
LPKQHGAKRRGKAPIRRSVGASGPAAVDLSTLLKEKALTLPPKQRRLAEMLLSAPEETVFGTLRSVAGWSGLSPLTVLRFTKALGFDGYHSFQNAARASFLKRTDAPRPFHVSETSAVVTTLEQHRVHLLELSQRTRVAELAAVCECIEKAKRIIICSSGPAQEYGNLLAKQLLYAGFAAQVIPALGVNSKVALHQVAPGDVFIGIHLSLLQAEIYEAFDLAHSRGASTIVIAGTPVSRLAQQADHFLYAHAEGKTVQFSFVALTALCEVLVAHLIERNSKKVAGISKVILDLALEERLSGAAENRRE